MARKLDQTKVKKMKNYVLQIKGAKGPGSMAASVVSAIAKHPTVKMLGFNGTTKKQAIEFLKTLSGVKLDCVDFEKGTETKLIG